jgi:transcriptional regulator with XRE-family HTH domain
MLLEVYGMDYSALGKRVRIRRKALGLTQEKLAEIVDVSTSFIGHIERGTRKLSVETLYDLCKALDVSADYLMGI